MRYIYLTSDSTTRRPFEMLVSDVLASLKSGRDFNFRTDHSEFDLGSRTVSDWELALPENNGISSGIIQAKKQRIEQSKLLNAYSALNENLQRFYRYRDELNGQYTRALDRETSYLAHQKTPLSASPPQESEYIRKLRERSGQVSKIADQILREVIANLGNPRVGTAGGGGSEEALARSNVSKIFKEATEQLNDHRDSIGLRLLGDILRAISCVFLIGFVYAYCRLEEYGHFFSSGKKTTSGILVEQIKTALEGVEQAVASLNQQSQLVT